MRSVALLLLLAMPAAAEEAVDWQAAVGRLAAERTRAETCVRIFKGLVGADAAARARGDLAYSAAKAEMDGVIARLAVAIGQDEAVRDPAGFEARLAQALAQRDAFCETTLALVPPEAPTKDVWGSVLSAVIEGTIGAAVDIYLQGRELDADTRDTLRIQVENERWPAFSAVEP